MRFPIIRVYDKDTKKLFPQMAAVYFKTEKEAQAFADKLNMENGMPVSKTEFEPEYKEMSLF